jgi:hypothetical protein
MVPCHAVTLKAKQICADNNPTYESRSLKLKFPILDEFFSMRFKEAKDQTSESVESKLTAIQFKIEIDNKRTLHCRRAA